MSLRPRLADRLTHRLALTLFALCYGSVLAIVLAPHAMLALFR